MSLRLLIRGDQKSNESSIPSTFVWTYQPENGGTRVSVSIDYTIPGAMLGKLAEPIIISNPVADQGTPAVAGNEKSGKYLVTWRHASDPPYMWLNIRG